MGKEPETRATVREGGKKGRGPLDSLSIGFGRPCERKGASTEESVDAGPAECVAPPGGLPPPTVGPAGGGRDSCRRGEVT